MLTACSHPWDLNSHPMFICHEYLQVKYTSQGHKGFSGEQCQASVTDTKPLAAKYCLSTRIKVIGSYFHRLCGKLEKKNSAKYNLETCKVEFINKYDYFIFWRTTKGGKVIKRCTSRHPTIYDVSAH